MVKTVGELKKLIENVPDDYKLETLDQYGNELLVTEFEMMADEDDEVCFLYMKFPDPDDED